MAGNLHAAHSNAVIHTHADLASACPGGGGQKQNKTSSDQILSYFTYILLII